MPFDAKKLGLLLAQERRRKGMSQENLSAFAGLSRSHLAAIEKGGVSIRLETLWRLCDALGISPGETVKKCE